MSTPAGSPATPAANSVAAHDTEVCACCVPPSASLFEMAARRTALKEQRRQEAVAREAGMDGQDMEAFLELCREG